MSLAKWHVPLARQQHIVLDGISWESYERLLRDVGARPIRITYDRGSIEIMSPLPKHEKWKSKIGRCIELMALELGIDIEPLGSTTFQRKVEKAGLEPDECYYVQRAAAIRGKDRINLKTDPPPDLAVEIDITRRSIKREPIYARLRVPEIWRYDGKRLTVRALVEDDHYVDRDASLAFPSLSMAEFATFIERMKEEDDLTVMRAFQQWVRSLKP